MFPGFLICPSVLGRDGDFVEKVGPLFSESPGIFLPGKVWSLAGAKWACLPASRRPVEGAWSEKQCHRVATQRSLRACSGFIQACVECGFAWWGQKPKGCLSFFLPASHRLGTASPSRLGARICQVFRSSSRPYPEKRLMTWLP